MLVSSPKLIFVDYKYVDMNANKIQLIVEVDTLINLSLKFLHYMSNGGGDE